MVGVLRVAAAVLEFIELLLGFLLLNLRMESLSVAAVLVGLLQELGEMLVNLQSLTRLV